MTTYTMTDYIKAAKDITIIYGRDSERAEAPYTGERTEAALARHLEDLEQQGFWAFASIDGPRWHSAGDGKLDPPYLPYATTERWRLD